MEIKINKSNIEKLTWNNRVMKLYFESGAVVAYQDVPEGIAVGVGNAPSAGSYINRYVVGEYSYVVEEKESVQYELDSLRHHKDTTVGLWATDRPELIPEEVKELFFQINYNQTPSR